jgi:hypothetical protein
MLPFTLGRAHVRSSLEVEAADLLAGGANRWREPIAPLEHKVRRLQDRRMERGDGLE